MAGDMEEMDLKKKVKKIDMGIDDFKGMFGMLKDKKKDMEL